MTRYINPDPQHFDVDGNPCAFYVVYFGLPNQDPITNPKAPYSDEALTVPISTTQTLDNQGAYQQDIYLNGAYSIRIETPLGSLFYETESFEGTFQLADLSEYLKEGGSIGSFTVTDEIIFDGAAGNDGTIGKNQTATRDELKIYSAGDAFEAGSRGSGIHLYGNSDSQHAGNFVVLTGNNDVGKGRLGVAGGGFNRGGIDDTRVTIGNGVFDFMDTLEDTAMLNLHNPQNRPAICFFDTNSETEGELAVPSGENFSIGHWDTGTEVFTRRIAMDTVGNLELYDLDGQAGNIGMNDGASRQILEIRGRSVQTNGGWINLYGSLDNSSPNEVTIGSGNSAAPKIAVTTTGVEIDGLKLKGACNVTAAGGTNSSTGLTSVTRTGNGVYRIVLSSGAANANNLVISGSLSGQASFAHAIINASTVDIYTLAQTGTPTDSNFTAKIEEIV